MESRDRDEEALSGTPQEPAPSRSAEAKQAPRGSEEQASDTGVSDTGLGDTGLGDTGLGDTGLSDTAKFRLRVLAGCLVMVGIAFIQSPGFLISDTKFDLATAPLDFLSRALHLWDDEGGLGQLQNQAYGYLWPMGPFFALFVSVGLPGWVVQRLWIGMVMAVAFAGTAKLGRELGIRSQAAVLVAALAFATSPRMLSQIGPISIEVWPSAIAPWVLVALVIGAKRGSPRRAALWAGLAVGMVGGVNAVATFAVIPLGVVWLLTRERGVRRRTMMIWWPIFTLLATAWWLVPLFVMGAYSPPFLDYIETASVTTAPTTIFDALRGTSSWVVYIDQALQAGNQLVTQYYLVLNSGIVLLVGLVGIMLRGNPHRRFLVIGLATGLVLVTFGHTGSVQGFFAGDLHALLDGVLSPMRNVHKFDPIIRLPLVLGIAYFIDAAVSERSPMPIPLGRRRVLPLSTHHVFAGLALLGVIGSAVPAFTGQLAMTRPVASTPGYWEQAADWLADADGAEPEGEAGGSALLVPGSNFGSYLWGYPRDEPMQWLAGSRWAVRNAIPLAPPGNIRMLDGIEARLAQGRGGPGLTDYLSRAGIKYLVVRNDLQPSNDVPDPVLVQQAIAASPGLTRMAGFGPKLGGGTDLVNDTGRILINGGWREARSAIEIYRVPKASGRSLVADQLPRVVGGPEDLVDLSEAGIAHGQPTELAMDADSEPHGPLVLTDGMVEVERAYGRIHDATSSARLPGDPHTSGNPHADYLPEGAERWLTRARLSGVDAVTASSSTAEATTPGGARPAQQPFAAIDGSVESQWVARSSEDGEDWWQVDLSEPGDPEEIEITLGDAGTEGASVVVSTEAGDSDVVELRRGVPSKVLLPPGDTSWIRITRPTESDVPLSLREVSLPGVEPRRDLVLPSTPASWGDPAAILLRRQSDGRTGCVQIEQRTPCLQERAVPEEEPADVNRALTLEAGGDYAATLTARPRPGPALETLLQQDRLVTVTGSTTGVRDPRGAGRAAFDGDFGTTWTPELTDETPVLALNWLGKRRLTGLRMSVPDAAPVRRPTEVIVRTPKSEQKVSLNGNGVGRLKRPVRTDQVTLQITDAGNAASQDNTGLGSPLPIGVSELKLTGGPNATPLSEEVRDYRCGTGPTIRSGGEDVRTRLVASPSQLAAMEQVPARACGPGTGPRDRDEIDLGLDTGENELRMVASDVAVGDSLLLDGGWESGTTMPAPTRSESPADYTIEAPGGGSVVVTHQNANPGWRLTQDGSTLTPVTVDGWQQGALLDSDAAGDLSLTFTPDRPYRWALGIGLVVLAGLVLLLWPARRWRGVDLPALAGARIPVPVTLGLGLVAGGLLAGIGGLVVTVVGYGAGYLLARRQYDLLIWSSAMLMMVVAFAYSVRPWGNSLGWAGDWSWPHYLVVLVLSVAFWVAAEAGLPRLRRRRAGTST